MANIIKYNSRLTLKYDTLSNWCPSGTWINFTPLKGEVCIINPAEDFGTDTPCLIKVGDGVTKIGSLPYLGAVAADVYDWAKAQSVEYNATDSTIDFYNIKRKDGKDVHVPVLSVSLEPITSAIDALDTRIDAINISTATETDYATSSIVSITKDKDEDDNELDTYTAVSKPLPTVQSATAKNNITFDATKKGYAVIADVTQSKGAIVPTKKYIPQASNSIPGVVKLDIANQDTAISKKTYDDRVNAVNGTIKGIQDDIASYKVGGTDTDKNDWCDAPNGNSIKATYATKLALKDVADDLTDLENRIDNVANVMHFVGAVTSDPTAESFDVSAYHNGDVVVWTGEGREFVFVWPLEGTETPGVGHFEEVGDVSRIAELETAVAAHKSYTSVRLSALEGSAWKTNIGSNETVAEGSATTEISALTAQDLKIGITDIAYIVWDCGSATVNV